MASRADSRPERSAWRTLIVRAASRDWRTAAPPVRAAQGQRITQATQGYTRRGGGGGCNRRGAQRECFKLLGSKRGFIFTPASTFCSNNEEIMEPWTGQTRAQSLFLKLLGLKSGFIFMLACKPVCSSTMEEPTLLFTGRQAES